MWQTDGWAYVGMFFVVFVMLWTNSIIGEIKRYTVCGAIGLWYYRRESSPIYLYVNISGILCAAQ